MGDHKSVGALVGEWRQLSRDAQKAGEFERARALAEDANQLFSRLQGARTRIQERHYDLTLQWPMKRVLIEAVDAELGTIPDA